MFLAISLSAESIHAHMPHHTCARHTGGKETQNAPHQRRPVTEITYTAELTSTCDCSKLDRHHGGVEAADGCGVRTDRSDGHQTVQTVTLLVQPVTSIVCLCIYIIKSMSMNAMDSSSITQRTSYTSGRWLLHPNRNVIIWRFRTRNQPIHLNTY